jgi:hypothetical protein
LISVLSREENDNLASQEAGLNLDLLLFGSGIAAEFSLILLLIRTRAFRTFPAFFLYVCWSLVSDPLIYLAQTHLSPAAFLRIYLIQLTIDAAMIFMVLVEIAWGVLRPLRASLPKYSWIVIASLIALAGTLLWPIAGLTFPAHLSSAGATLFRLEQTFAILRIVVFLALAGFSQLLLIGWRNRELQLATGLGLYSIISLAVTILHTRQVVGAQYHWLDELVSFSYVGVLIYWAVAFATREAERKEFTPQMRDFLLAAAGTARSTRMALMDSTHKLPENKDRF